MTASYHHGDLRAAAVRAAVAEAARVGPTAVSLREVARIAGVSHAALRYQFGDKAGLFTAVAVEGFSAIAAWSAGGGASLLDGGWAYIAFGTQHPGYFDVMFRPDLHHADDPDLVTARGLAFGVLHGLAVESGAGDPRALALAAWSMAHGFATLANAGNLADGEADPAWYREHLRAGMAALGRLAARP